MLSRSKKNHQSSGRTFVAATFVFLLMLSAAITTTWIQILPIITGHDLSKLSLSNMPPFMNRSNILPPNHKTSDSSKEDCPHYFSWIDEDLKPWKKSGITKEMVERAKDFAHIRVIIKGGKVYVQKLKWVFETRDVFSIWGILQLLRLYPGMLPDMEIMLECGDKPVIEKNDYNDDMFENSTSSKSPPPVFHYCGDDSTLDIVFPDWSFWGWPEVNIPPWETFMEDLKKSNDKIKWDDREPYAYWKGNSLLTSTRYNLVAGCHVSKGQDWNIRADHLDWGVERRQGFRLTNITSQCSYRYKIYVEGIAWSVSEKYILACDSISLFISPEYYDFFTRSLLPMVHYWPINKNNLCRSIKFALNWGNKNTWKSKKIGKAGSSFVQEKLRMKYVYDYMFHLLYKYAKLQKNQPKVPKDAVEMSIETLISSASAQGLEKRFMTDSMVKSPAKSGPCIMPTDNPLKLETFLERKDSLSKVVEELEANQPVL